MRVEVFKHLPKSKKMGFPVYSVRCIDRGYPKDFGRVVTHTTEVYVANARPAVQPAGQRKVRETGVKNVHAFIRGDLVGAWQAVAGLQWEDVTYNPKRDDTFVLRSNGAEFTGSWLVELGPDGVKAVV